MDRLTVAGLMLRCGGPLRPLALMVMKPDQLIEFGRRHCYHQNRALDNWSDEQVLEHGLLEEEKDILRRCGKSSGRALVLGVGGGRDAIALAGLGFQTVGVDNVSAMVCRAGRNAEKRGVALELAVQEISRLGFTDAAFELVFSSAMYSCIPTRKRRIAMLRDIHRTLKADGHMVCGFFWRPAWQSSPIREKVKKLTATLTRGYREYEYGDFLRGGAEFLHGFHDKELLMAEFHESGFHVQFFTIFKNGFFGAALLKRKG